MPWTDRYRSKLTTAAQALSFVEPGQFLYLGGNAATPRHLAA